MSTTTALLTVAEFLKLPDPKEGCLELHHGEVVIVPPPKLRHAILQDRFADMLKAQLRNRGMVLVEMPFQPAPEFEVWRADVGYMRTERAEISGFGYLEGAPDLAVEVLSPSNTADEIDDRRTTCMSNGCVSFWVVNDKRKIISVTEGDVTKHYGLSSKIPSTFLPEEVSVEDLLK
jgi:Uma2 family endonuclease